MKSASRRHSGVDQSILARLDRHGTAPYWSTSRSAMFAGAGVLVLCVMAALAWSARGQIGAPDPSALAARASASSGTGAGTGAGEPGAFALPATLIDRPAGFELPPLVMLPEAEPPEPEVAATVSALSEPLPVARVPLADVSRAPRARRSRPAPKVLVPAPTQAMPTVDRDVAVLSAILSLSSRHGGHALPECVSEGPRTPCSKQTNAQP